MSSVAAPRSSAWMRSAELGAGQPAGLLAERGGQRPVHLEQARRRASTSALPMGASSKEERKRCSASLSVALALVAVGHVGDHGDDRGHLVAVEHRGGGEDRPELAAVAPAEADVVELAAAGGGGGRRATPPASGRCRRPGRGAGCARSSSGSHPSSSAMRRLVKVVRPSVSMTQTPRCASSSRRSSSPVMPGGAAAAIRGGRGSPAPLISTSASASLVERSTTSQGRRSSPRGAPGPPSPVHRRWPGALPPWPGPRAGAARCRSPPVRSPGPAGAEGSRRMRHVPFHMPPAAITPRSSFPSCPSRPNLPDGTHVDRRVA